MVEAIKPKASKQPTAATVPEEEKKTAGSRKPAAGTKPAPARGGLVPAKPKKPAFPYEFTSRQQRLQSVQTAPNLSRKDPLLSYMLANMETNFPPKMVCGPSDWLVTQSEPGQTIQVYQQGGPLINWINTRKEAIYLFLIDDSIDDQTAEKLKLYCEAYFTGVEVKMVRAGQSIKDGNKTKRIPRDFIGKHRIATRDNNGIFQINATDILRELKNYRVADTFCILAVTNQDLYPKDEWNYVFGLAMQTAGVGVFSFCRHQVGFYGEQTTKSEEEQAQTWLKRALGTMTHEIGHMFGLQHCIYYECTMNGTNGPGDGAKVKGKTLCPICLLKLKLNIKFDTKARYEALAQASRTIGLESKAAQFEHLLSQI